jgi:CrcB protein
MLTVTDGRFAVPVLMRQFVIIGLCGGYTTFSAFSLQTFAMINRGDWAMAAGHIFGSVALCLLAVWAGASLAGIMARE